MLPPLDNGFLFTRGQELTVLSVKDVLRGAALIIVSAFAFAAFGVSTASAEPGPGVNFFGPVEGSTVTDSAGILAKLDFSNNVTVVEQHCRLDDAPYGDCFDVQSFQPAMRNGAHRYYVRTLDVDGDVHIDTVNFTIDDTDAPTFSAAAVGGSPVSDRPRFEITLDDEAATVVATIDGRGPERFIASGGSFTWTPESIPNGSYDVTFKAIDPALNVSTSVVSVEIDDQTAPTINLNVPVDGSSVPTGDLEAVFTTDDPDARFTCSVDGAAPEYCSPSIPFAVEGLTDLAHSVTVNATDSVGNTNSATSFFSVTSDFIEGLTIDSPADGSVQTAQPRFQVTTSVPIVASTLRCSVNGSAFRSCNEGQPLIGVDGNGFWALEVRARTVGGAKLYSQAGFTVNDTTPPDLSMTPGPVEVDDVDNFAFPATVSDQYADAQPSNQFAILCSVDGAPTTDCMSALLGPLVGLPPTLTPGATHTIDLSATDWVGNTASGSTSVNVTDVTGPTVTILSPVDASTVSGGGVTVEYRATGGEGFNETTTCQIDSQTPVLCNGSEFDGIQSWTPQNLTPGAHTLTVARLDLAGNLGSDSISITVTDSTGPTLAFITPTSGATLTDRVATVFASNEKILRVRCAVDNGAAVAVDENQCDTYANDRRMGFYRPASITNGAHSLWVEVTDVHGNVTLSSLALTVADNTAPNVRFDQTLFADGFASSESPSEISYSSSDPTAAFTCQLDSETPYACGTGASSSEVPPLSNGPHTFSVTAIDPSGNSSGPIALNFTVTDITPPALTVSGVTEGMAVGATLTVDVSTDAGSTTTCAVDAGAYSACGLNHTFTFVASGARTVRFRATDPAGNSTDRDFTVNATVPVDPGPTPPVTPPTPPPAVPPAAPAPAVAKPSIGKFVVKSTKKLVTIKYTTAVGLPAGADLAAACTGKAAVVARVGKKTVSRASATLKIVSGKCTVAGTLKAKPKAVAGKKFQVQVSFAGNAKLAPFSITKAGKAGKARF